jgi:hypothetical protein
MAKTPKYGYCGPHKSFPIKGPKSIRSAARLAGHAANPSAVRACVKRKARQMGATGSLPKSWRGK